MFAKNNNYVNYFIDPSAKNTDKITYGRISESIKTGLKDAGGNEIYEHESWNARFVGAAHEKIQQVPDKARLQLTVWNARNPYNKEKKRSYPYLLVMDFEIVQAQESQSTQESEMSYAGPATPDFAELDDSDAQLPF